MRYLSKWLFFDHRERKSEKNEQDEIPNDLDYSLFGYKEDQRMNPAFDSRVECSHPPDLQAQIINYVFLEKEDLMIFEEDRGGF